MNNRNEEIIKRVLNGERSCDLAVEFGVTRQRIEQIYRRYVANKAYNESTSELERLTIKATNHGMNYYAIMGAYDVTKTHTLEDLLNISTEKLMENLQAEWHGELTKFSDSDGFYMRKIEWIKKKAAKIIAKREKETH